MPDTATIGKTPRTLPYFERHYKSTVTDYVTPWFFHEYVSRVKEVEIALQQAEIEDGEAAPTPAAISGIVRVISKSKVALSQPDISVFHGEAIVTWRKDNREVSLVSRGGADDPKLIKYEAGQNRPSTHEICASASAKNLNKAIRWLYE
jgi:hypothetical protein